MDPKVTVHHMPRLSRPIFVVYQAYGLQEILRQTLYSALSLLYELRSIHALDKEKIKIVIYTDNKDFFLSFFGQQPQIIYELLNPEKIKKWRGEIDFVHRVKIETLRDLRSKNRGNLFYLDGDTYFTKSPVEIFSVIEASETLSIMHELEGQISKDYNLVAKKVRKFLESPEYPEKEIGYRIPSQTQMWNAGVLGIAEKNLEWLDEVLNLTDKMHARYQKHVIEQLAFSYILQTKGQVFPAPEIGHYWRNKDAFNVFIQSFFSNSPNFSSALLNYPTAEPPPLFPPKLSPVRKLLKKWGF